MADTKIVTGQGFGAPKSAHKHKHKHPPVPPPDPPPFSPYTLTTIYVRQNGSDKNGDGSQRNPYRTFQRAVQDVPFDIPAAVFYRIDITGITENLPTDYTVSAWKTWAINETALAGQTYTNFQPGVEIYAQPQPVAALPHAATIINAADVASVTADPLTKLLTINLVHPRASWTQANLQGKQILVGPTDPSPTTNNSVVSNVNSTSSITITLRNTPTYPLSLVEPSATLHGSGTNWGTIRANNCDSVGFTGIRIISDNGTNGLNAQGGGTCMCQLCELQSPVMTQVSAGLTRTADNRANSCWIYGNATFGGGTIFIASLLLDATAKTSTDVPFFTAPIVALFDRTVFNGCDPIEVLVVESSGGLDGAITPHLFMQYCLVTGSTGDGLTFHGGKASILNCDFNSNAGNGVTVNEGAGLLALTGVGSSAPNSNLGLAIADGMRATADATTVGNATPLTGGTGQVQVGNLAVQTWASIGALFAANPLNTVNDSAGPTATGSNLASS